MPVAIPLAFAAIAASTTAQVVQAQKQANLQKQALAQQAAAQTQAAASASRQQMANEEAFNKANRKQPDVAGTLLGEQSAAKMGTASTMLTGVGGVDPNRLLLGKSSLLGG